MQQNWAKLYSVSALALDFKWLSLGFRYKLTLVLKPISLVWNTSFDKQPALR